MQAFRKVIAPLAAPGIVTTAILVFIFGWNEFLFAISLTSTKAAHRSGGNRVLHRQLAIQEPTGSIAAGHGHHDSDHRVYSRSSSGGSSPG